MEAEELNARLAQAFGWRQDERYPGCWIPPGQRVPSKGVYYTQKPSDYLTGDGMLKVLGEMRKQPTRVWELFCGLVVIRITPPDASVHVPPSPQHVLQRLFMDLAPELICRAALTALEQDAARSGSEE